jgi:hypothetical protein
MQCQVEQLLVQGSHQLPRTVHRGTEARGDNLLGIEERSPMKQNEAVGIKPLHSAVTRPAGKEMVFH